MKKIPKFDPYDLEPFREIFYIAGNQISILIFTFFHDSFSIAETLFRGRLFSFVVEKFTDIWYTYRVRNVDDPRFVIQNWMCNTNTIVFL